MLRIRFIITKCEQTDHAGGELRDQSLPAGMISAAPGYLAKRSARCLEEIIKNSREDSKRFASEF
jgi:hypothetical protein